MKKTILLFTLAVYASTSIFAVIHGSIIKKNAPLDVEVDWTHGTTFPSNSTVDYRVVTIGGKLWATVIGKGYSLHTNPWSSQIRLYSPEKFELDRANAPDNVIDTPYNNTTIVTAYPYSAFDQISIVQAQNDAYNGTEIIAYNVDAVNSGLTGDDQKPVLTKAEIGTQDGTSLPISCKASDDSGDYFYLVTDIANNYYFVSFTDDFTITGLDPSITYTFSVVAVDFSGNESSGLTTSVKETNKAKIALSQNQESIVVNSPETLRSIKLYSNNGQLITSKTSTNIIVTSGFAKGVYVLKVQDIQGSLNTFKVVLK